MITVELVGWNILYGPYRFSVRFDDSRQDYEIHIGRSIFKQKTPFRQETKDWNHDGDVYENYGAWFVSDDGGYEFFSPEQLLVGIADEQFTVPGLKDPKAPLKVFIREHPVEVKGPNNNRYQFKINLEEQHFCIEMASGREWRQISDFEKTSLEEVSRGKSQREVLGAWFESWNDEAWVSRFFTLDELAQMVTNEQALHGDNNKIEPASIIEKTKSKHHEKVR